MHEGGERRNAAFVGVEHTLGMHVLKMLGRE